MQMRDEGGGEAFEEVSTVNPPEAEGRGGERKRKGYRRFKIQAHHVQTSRAPRSETQPAHIIGSLLSYK